MGFSNITRMKCIVIYLLVKSHCVMVHRNMIEELESCKPEYRSLELARVKLISKITLLYRLINYIDGGWKHLYKP